MKNKGPYAVGVLALLAILIAAPVSAQTPKADRGADKAAVEQTFRDYVAAFVSGDPKRIATYYHEPAMLVGVGKVLGTTTELEKFFAGVRADLQSSGYADFVFDQLAVKLLGQNVAFLSYIGERRTKDGAVLGKVAASCFLRRTDAGWKIAATVAHPPDDFIKLD